MPLTVKQLKKRIKKLPDDMPVAQITEFDHVDILERVPQVTTPRDYCACGYCSEIPDVPTLIFNPYGEVLKEKYGIGGE